jgi:hypothetical protein
VFGPVCLDQNLYFELTRATYATKVIDKRDDFRSEQALHGVKFMFSLFWHVAQAHYPKKAVDKIIFSP